MIWSWRVPAPLLGPLALALLGATAAAQTTNDYDDDNDGLIEIKTLAQLNAVRYDLDGDGAVSATNTAAYRAAFPSPAAGMGCPVTNTDADNNDCTGYELDNDLDFDTDGDGDVDANDPGSYPNWAPIGGDFTATFEGNGHTISHLTANRSSGHVGLFSYVKGVVRNLGLADVDLTSTGDWRGSVAALANYVSGGKVIGVWATGSVAASSTARTAGLARGLNDGGRIGASFFRGSVECNSCGGLLYLISHGTLTASYFSGSIMARFESGGLIHSCGGDAADKPSTIKSSYIVATQTAGSQNGFTAALISQVEEYDGPCNVGDTYHDSTSSGSIPKGSKGLSRSSTELRAPTSAAGIYVNWDDLDVVGDGTADEDPWNFGTSSQYPVLSYGSLSAAQQFAWQPEAEVPTQTTNDYDIDDDSLIEIKTLAQLNAVRYDLDGDGAVSATDATAYSAAFPSPAAGMGCPVTATDADNNDCIGYELDNDLDFDIDGDGDVDANDTGSYPNWESIGGDFTATFEGNGHTISRLTANRSSRGHAGLFESVGGVVRNLGLPDVNLRSSSSPWGTAAALAGGVAGTVTGVWATGSVTGTSGVSVAGLVDGVRDGGWVATSFFRGSLQGANVGGLVYGVGHGTLTASYFIGSIDASWESGGLVHSCGGMPATSPRPFGHRTSLRRRRPVPATVPQAVFSAMWTSTTAHATSLTRTTTRIPRGATIQAQAERGCPSGPGNCRGPHRRLASTRTGTTWT